MDPAKQNGPGGVNGGSGMSKAERFEDEKQRIVNSCFDKKDEDGSLIESYITHIRIIEDAAYPASPPPTNSNPATKKPRLVIVSVRKSGRVRMHKARENGNGTFSIGKTWMLDDLSAIQSFTGLVPKTPEEEQQKQWAGGNGFIVNIGKSYYWQANTQKEKEFFIASLAKIYTKYTGGKMPQLSGFEPREMEQLMGGSARPQPPSQLQSPTTPMPPYPQAQSRPPLRDPSREPGLRSQPSRDAVQRPSAQASPIRAPASVDGLSVTSRPPTRSRRMESPSDSTVSNGSSATLQSQTALRRVAGGNQSQESFGRSDDGSSLPPRSRGGLNGLPSAPGRFPDRSVTPTSQRATTPDSTFSSSRDISEDVPPVPAPLALPPERRRPPLPIMSDSRQRTPNLDENIIPAPLASPGMRRDNLQPPDRSSERSLPRQRDSDTMGNLSPQPILNGQAESPRRTSADLRKGEVTQSPLSIKTAAVSQQVSTPTTRTPVDKNEPEEETRPGLGPMIKQKPAREEAPDSPPEPEETRPGLGPMIKIKSPVTSPMEPPEEPEQPVRPGLGPMIRKKSRPEIANAFLSAAKSASSLSTFKPRSGGAAEKLREASKSQVNEEGPDGITGVIPAPRLARAPGSSSSVTTPARFPMEPIPTVKDLETPADVKSPPPKSEQPPTDAKVARIATPKDTTSVEKPAAREVKRPKPASETMQKELASLGIDPAILGGRGHDLVAAWDEFGWVGEGVRTKNIDQMQDDIERQLNKIQAGGWLNKMDEEDERVEAIRAGLDICMDECDELDGLLTLYSVELSTLNEDIAFIEAQSQGLQVQAANQKLLQAELQSLLNTISISPDQLEGLSQASLESPRGIEQIESALVILYKAMLTIDPSLSLSGVRQSEDGGLGRSGGMGNSEIGSMQVLQEKKEVYRNDTATFLRRLRPFLQVKFAAAIDETRQALEREKGNSLARVGKVKLDPRNHDLARDVLWRYSPLMLFVREIDRAEWEELMKTYESASRPLYQDEFRDAVFAWKRTARKANGEEGDILFTSQVEKQAEGIATTARKLTVKRSQTLAKSLRSPMGDSNHKTSIDRSAPDGRLRPFEVFSGVLEEMLPIVTMEQNFIVKFFHVTSLEQYDFPDSVAAAPPEERRGGDLRRPRVMEPNRDLSKQVVQSMEEVYSTFPGDLQSLIDWSLQSDPLQSVGVIAAIERKLVDFEESSQEFLARTLQRQHTRLLSIFSKFLDEQIRAIEDTKVKIKKRKGVIGFMRIFPSFSLAVESMLTSADNLEIRETVNQAYTRINKTMFESLRVIARENPSAQTAGADPEDKEALNYQILLIENMNHYVEEVGTRSNPVLEEWKQNAEQEMEEHMTLYIGAVIRRPLGKLLDFIESIESLMNSRLPGEPPSKISGMTSHSKSTFHKVLAAYDSKEIKRGIETLKKRIEKHFGDVDDPTVGRNLVAAVQGQCEKYYDRVEDRILTISRDVYDGDVLMEWTRADVAAAFKRER